MRAARATRPASSSINLSQASIGGTFDTVAIPTDAVLLHAGGSAAISVYGAYQASALGTYGYTINLQSVGRDTTSGVGLVGFGLRYRRKGTKVSFA